SSTEAYWSARSPRITTISRAAAVRSGRSGRGGVVISGLLEMVGGEPAQLSRDHAVLQSGTPVLDTATVYPLCSVGERLRRPPSSPLVPRGAAGEEIHEPAQRPSATMRR